jgi:hypothetical protein
MPKKNRRTLQATIIGDANNTPNIADAGSQRLSHGDLFPACSLSNSFTLKKYRPSPQAYLPAPVTCRRTVFAC